MGKRKEIKSDQSAPFRFFKFREINKYSIDSLIMGTLYFSPRDKLNDPFDCRLDIKKAIKNAAKYLSKQGSGKDSANLIDLLNNNSFFDKLQTIIGNIGICSFSLKLNNVLLWSHYANKHKGISILYEFPMDFLNDKDKFIGIPDVTYNNNSLQKCFINIVNQLPMNYSELAIELLKQILAAKSPSWKYEKEVRIIRSNPGLLKIEKNFIKQICFGLDTQDEDVALIKEITDNYKEKVQLCKAIRASSDFGVRFKKI